MSAGVRRGVLLIPAYNEEARLGAVLEQIAQTDTPYQVVVIDDGSSDGTADVARRAGATVLSLPFNLGYGAALQTGYKYALVLRAPFVVQMDADGQHEASEIPKLLEPVRSGELDIAIGSRFLEPDGYRMSAPQQLGRLLFRAVAGILGLHVTDPTSGFQAMNRHVLEVYEADAFPTDYPDIDVLLMAQRHSLAVGERAVAMKPTPRRSTLHAGLRPLYYVYKMLLSSVSARAHRSRPHPVKDETT